LKDESDEGGNSHYHCNQQQGMTKNPLTPQVKPSWKDPASGLRCCQFYHTWPMLSCIGKRIMVAPSASRINQFSPEMIAAPPVQRGSDFWNIFSAACQLAEPLVDLTPATVGDQSQNDCQAVSCHKYPRIQTTGYQSQQHYFLFMGKTKDESKRDESQKTEGNRSPVFMLMCMLSLPWVFMVVFVLDFLIGTVIVAVLSLKIAHLLPEQFESQDQQQSCCSVLYPGSFKIQPPLEQHISDDTTTDDIR
jgi:hypothetical protein